MTKDSFAANEALICALEKRSQLIGCTEGGILFKQGDISKGVFILRTGEAVLTMESDSGGVVMCLHAEAGSLLGLPSIITGNPYSLTAIARKGSEVRLVTRRDFEDIVQADPDLYPLVLQVLASEVRAARQALSAT